MLQGGQQLFRLFAFHQGQFMHALYSLLGCLPSRITPRLFLARKREEVQQQ
jgi:hypothetical protein